MTASYRDGILISAEQKISRLQSLIQQRRDILDALNRNASDISKIEVSQTRMVAARTHTNIAYDTSSGTFVPASRTSSDKPQSVIGQALSQGNEFKKHGSKRQRNAKWSIKENVLGNKIVWRDSLTSKGSETN